LTTVDHENSQEEEQLFKVVIEDEEGCIDVMDKELQPEKVKA